jgi:hypothetical protein
MRSHWTVRGIGIHHLTTSGLGHGEGDGKVRIRRKESAVGFIVASFALLPRAMKAIVDG